MKTKSIVISVLLLLFVLTVWATDDPHGTINSVACEQCHTTHSGLGDILINSTDSLVATLCLSCHTPGGWVPMAKQLSSADQAIPGTSGSSHQWSAPADNLPRGAEVPQTQALLDHLSADGRITCATCHDPHSNTIPPFLRVDNSADALCLDCHRSRNTSSTKTYTGLTQSHPIGVTIPGAKPSFHPVPLDADGNPQPSDGNLTNDFKLLAGGTLGCTTCHGVHYTDSDPVTVDGP